MGKDDVGGLGCVGVAKIADLELQISLMGGMVRKAIVEGSLVNSSSSRVFCLIR